MKRGRKDKKWRRMNRDAQEGGKEDEREDGRKGE